MAKSLAVPFLRTAFNYDRDLASLESALECADASMTQQSFQEECDINTIVRRFGLTGQLPVGVRAPTFGDFTGVFDFQSALGAVRDAEQAFNRMPADVRSRFGNDPNAFVNFCSDDRNREEAERLGLVLPKDPAPAPAEPAGPVKA
ncbi:MAG: internal scaffolding protein [Arizlama microvirus]|nr:MAG: internal scaffolding protein [Arizlama microvirus]